MLLSVAKRTLHNKPAGTRLARRSACCIALILPQWERLRRYAIVSGMGCKG
jgi:hypothetical protein